ncbi:MAG: hypothetical protein H0T88_04090 [Lysobacter sp.]|nr:hypothetical protein [Lysobacter sp.]
MERKEILRAPISKEGVGIEIGPSYDPVAPKRDGYNVEIIDYTDRVGLVEKYKPLPIDTSVIEEVDHVWGGQSYAELTGKPGHYDWVIASHMIEHSPDLVGFLKNCAGILTERGVLSLAVPDKRYCFDRFRPNSSISQVIDAHLIGRTISSPGNVADFYLNTIRHGGRVSWSEQLATETEFPHIEFIHDDGLAESEMRKVQLENTYVDVHAWCFTPSSFRLMIQDVGDLGLQPLREIDFVPTQGCEFFVTLSKNGDGPRFDRLDMLKRIEMELSQFAGVGVW